MRVSGPQKVALNVTFGQMSLCLTATCTDPLEDAVPKQSPIPNELDAPFYTAANEERLVLQYCMTDDRWQYPPEPVCGRCGSADKLEWREVSGDGTVYSYAVIHDTPIVTLQADQPYNCAVVELNECPGILFLSHLPGTPLDAVIIGSPVELTFETTPATGQKVPEWRSVTRTP